MGNTDSSVSFDKCLPRSSLRHSHRTFQQRQPPASLLSSHLRPHGLVLLSRNTPVLSPTVLLCLS